MQLFLNILGLASSLVLSFISSAMETSLYRVSRVRMRIRHEKGEKRAGLVLRLVAGIDSMVTAILVENNIAAYTGTYFLASQLATWRTPHAEIITTIVVAPLFFIFTESLPKQLAYNNADRWALELSRIFAAIRLSLTPLVWLLNRMSAGLRRLFGSGGGTSLVQSQRTLLLEHLNAGVAENVLTEEQNSMAARIMELECISARDCMLPLRKLTLLPEGATRGQAAAAMRGRKASLALLVDGAGRVTGGMVSMNSLVFAGGGSGDSLDAVVERLERVRGNVAILEALNIFRTRHTRLALVADGGHVHGLITTQSVLDRIAGIV